VHALPQRLRQFRLPAVKKQFHVLDGFLINLRRGQALDTWPQAAANVKLQTRARMGTVQIDITGRDQKVPVNQVNDSVSQVGREVRAVINATVFLQAASDVYPRKALAQGQLHVWISLVIPQ